MLLPHATVGVEPTIELRSSHGVQKNARFGLLSDEGYLATIEIVRLERWDGFCHPSDLSSDDSDCPVAIAVGEYVDGHAMPRYQGDVFAVGPVNRFYRSARMVTEAGYPIKHDPAAVDPQVPIDGRPWRFDIRVDFDGDRVIDLQHIHAGFDQCRLEQLRQSINGAACVSYERLRDHR